MAEELEVIPPASADVGSTSLVPAGAADVAPVIDADIVDDGKPGTIVPSAAAPAVGDDEINIDLVPIEDLNIKSLRGHFQKHPDFAKLDSTVPAIHNWLYTNARRSALLEDYRSVFATPESAKDALQAANDMLDLEADYLDPQTGSPTRMLERLWQMSLVRDQSGQITGSSGAFEALVSQLRQDMFAQIEQYCKEKNDAYGLEALAHIAGLYSGQAPAKPAAGADNQLPDNVRKDLAELAQRREADKNRGAQDAQQYMRNLSQSMDTAAMDEAKSIMKDISDNNKLALNQFQKDLIVEDAVKRMAKKANDDIAYGNSFRQMLRKGRTAATAKEITKYVREYSHRHLVGIIAKGIEQMTGTVIAAAGIRRDKIAEQRQRGNPQGTGAVSTPTSPSLAERLAQRQSTIGRRRLSDFEVMEEVLNTEES